MLKIKLLETEIRTCVYGERVLLNHIKTQISLVYLIENISIIFLYGSSVIGSFAFLLQTSSDALTATFTVTNFVTRRRRINFPSSFVNLIELERGEVIKKILEKICSAVK